MIDTHSPHALAEGAYAERRASRSAAAAALGVSSLRDVTDAGVLHRLADDVTRRRARHVVTERPRPGRGHGVRHRGRVRASRLAGTDVPHGAAR